MRRRLDPDTLPDHLDRLYRAALAMTRSGPDAEDLVQETYAKVLARPRFIRRGDDLAYLLRAMRNIHLNRRRSAERAAPETIIGDGPEPVDARTGTRPEDAAATGEVFAALEGLPEEMRAVLIAVDVMGLSYEEAAEALSVKKGTIMSRLYRAREKAADALGGA